ncbi:MAG: hypothetical protein KDA85_07640, partial [Planctomycetaceae bacterium]|nr:hypothetical protein [Planctomycetaceae bacterium]
MTVPHISSLMPIQNQLQATAAPAALSWTEMAAIALQFGIPIAIGLCLMYAPAWLTERRSRQWQPRTRKLSAGLRRMECLVMLLAIGTGVATMTIESSSIPGQQWFHADDSAAVRGLIRWGLTVTGLSGLIALAVTYFRGVTWGAGLLVIGTLPAATGFSLTIVDQRSKEFHAKHQAEHVANGQTAQDDTAEMPVQIRLYNDLAGADVWVNGVHLGQTPITISGRELFEKLPSWDHQLTSEANTAEPSPRWSAPNGETIERWGWMPIHLRPGDHRTDLYYKVDFDGVVGYSRLIGQEHVDLEQPGQKLVVTLDTKFPSWEEQIERLLDQARLQDGQVSEAWDRAAASYGELLQFRIPTELSEQPALNERLQNRRAESRFHLDQIRTAADAWKLLMQFCEAAKRTGQWPPEEHAHVALQLIVPQLDQEQLLQAAEERLKQRMSREALYNYSMWQSSNSFRIDL